MEGVGRFTEIMIGVREMDGSLRRDKDRPTETLRLRVLFDQATGDLYTVQSSTTLRIKNVLLITLGVPLHFLGTLVWNVALIIFETLKGLFKPLALNKINSYASNCLRAPEYAFKCEVAAFQGLIHPREGMASFATTEREWNHGLLRRQDALRHSGTIEGESTFFAAYCYQPLGNLSSPHFVRMDLALQESLAS